MKIENGVPAATLDAGMMELKIAKSREIWENGKLKIENGEFYILHSACIIMQLGKYRHYKGKEYEVIGIAKHSETLEDLVVYKALYDSPKFGKNALRVRPKAMFEENVVVDDKEIKRFEYIGE